MKKIILLFFGLTTLAFAQHPWNQLYTTSGYVVQAGTNIVFTKTLYYTHKNDTATATLWTTGDSTWSLPLNDYRNWKFVFIANGNSTVDSVRAKMKFPYFDSLNVMQTGYDDNLLFADSNESNTFILINRGTGASNPSWTLEEVVCPEIYFYMTNYWNALPTRKLTIVAIGSSKN